MRSQEPRFWPNGRSKQRIPISISKGCSPAASLLSCPPRLLANASRQPVDQAGRWLGSSVIGAGRKLASWRAFNDMCDMAAL